MNFDSNLECVLFDLDGTLVDTAPDFVYALNNLLQEHKNSNQCKSYQLKGIRRGARAY